jgi:hypothetical protein
LGLAEDVDADLFSDLTYVDETGRAHPWRVADTTVDLPIDNDEMFTMRQVSLTVPGTKTGRGEHGQDATRQIHILTTRGDLPVEQVIYRMGSRWRQENYFRYARMHFDLDSHDAYATTDDDPARLVPNPRRRKPTRRSWPPGQGTTGPWPRPTRPYSKRCPRHRVKPCSSPTPRSTG